jgi:phosphoribosylformylglycinamidine synthase subunit PurSL
VTSHDRVMVAALGLDPRSMSLVDDAHALGVSAVESIRLSDVMYLRGNLDESGRSAVTGLLADALLQQATWGSTGTNGTWIVETALLPGVTDTPAAELLRAARNQGVQLDAAATGRRFEITGDLSAGDRDRMVKRLLANSVIERWAEGELTNPFDTAVAPLVPVEVVNVRGLSEAELAVVNAERGLHLDPAEMLAVQVHFTDIDRDPTDVELETLAQTWSEHCAHKTFRALITTTTGEVIEPLLAQLRRATDEINAPFVLSSFVGNAGIVSFHPGRTLALKAETHNHPSAIEPFGGANTGVGGVIRDILGAGHHPIACTDILCFGPTDLPADELPDGVLHPRRIQSGVIDGVADYGNKIGLPTVAGAVLYDPAYTANPLVFCGCIGQAEGWQPSKGPFPGDRIVAIGGRTGRDGLRGATFSSATMDATTGDVAGASVQIGDPVTEKLVMDVLAESQRLYTSITDCGAGGFSSAVGEMAEVLGADVELSTAPLKYPGLSAWEIWLSEAQERMVLSVAPDQVAALQVVCDRHGVELTDLGSFRDDGRLIVRMHGEVMLDLNTTFLHDGRPKRSMIAEMPTPDRAEVVPVVDDPAGALLALLAHPNLRSRADVVHRYDHEIRGTTVVRPLTGGEYDGHSDGVVLAEPADLDGFAIGIGVNPWFGLLDPQRMAHSVVDEAIRNAVVAGADPDRVVLLDNFSWGDPRRPSTLGALAAAVAGCCDAARAFGAPFVSGKDSLNNEYLGADGERHAVPPTLVITAVAAVPNADRATTTDLKSAGNVLILLGETRPEFGASHLSMVLGTPLDGAVPAADPGAQARYRGLHQAILAGLVQSAHDCCEGGLAVAVAEMAIGGRLGVELTSVAHGDTIVGLFSESNSRIICEVRPADVESLRAMVPGTSAVIGAVIAEAEIRLPGCAMVPLADALDAFAGHVIAGVQR